MSLKKIIRGLVPEPILLGYHRAVAQIGTIYYGNPSRHMIVIGVTGTKGKTSTSNFIWSCLSAAGIKTGIITTANIRIGEQELLNDFHMTMPGHFTIPRLMKRMRDEGCTVCVIETSSEGIKQSRNVGIEYDIAVFTNLSPEHLNSHNKSFDTYKNTKAKLFAGLTKNPHKLVHGSHIEKVIIVNADDDHADFFKKFPADKTITFGLEHGDMRATNIRSSHDGVSFDVHSSHYHMPLLGEFNIYNALPGLIINGLLGGSPESRTKGIANLALIPGRMERINAGQNFTVIVDYAHENRSMTALMKSAHKLVEAQQLKHSSTDNKPRIITLLGGQGGGRDVEKRFLMGETVGTMSDFVIATSDDSYDDNPRTIIEDIAGAAEKAGKVREVNLFSIVDRREAIAKAFSLAREGDIVLLTGKGAEQSIMTNEGPQVWDDRIVAREEISKLLNA